MTRRRVNGHSPFEQPVQLSRPPVQTAPLVFSSPHSGRIYPAEFVLASRLDPFALRRSEDSFVDQIFRQAPRLGAPLLKALFPRAYLDPNREPWELDPEMFDEELPPFVNTASPRVRGGFGTIARVVSGGAEIYRKKFSFSAAALRIKNLYRPYHDSLSRLIEETKKRFGFAILIDCHSMPSAERAGASDGRRPDFVLGDCYGASCAHALTERAEAALARLGHSVERNHPFSGAFITAHYGKPESGVHALQIEVNRALYMDQRQIVPTEGFSRLSVHLGGLIGELARITRGELDL